MQCLACQQLFHKWVLTPHWQEIRFTGWMNEAAIHEFERIQELDSPQSKFEYGVTHVQHILRIEALTRSIRGKDGVRLLDFGCGWGSSSGGGSLRLRRYRHRQVPDRQRVTKEHGITIVPDLAARGKSWVAPFHCVTLFQVLEHVEEPLELLRAIRDVMTEDAILILEVPNCERARHPQSTKNISTHIRSITSTASRRLRSMHRRTAGFTRVTPPVANVTCDAVKGIRGEVKRRAQRFQGSTQISIFDSLDQLSGAMTFYRRCT